jgi:hypothetical protein
MEPSPPVVLFCTTCGFIRLADDHTAAHARAAAHMHLSGHQGIEYSIIESPDRLMLAQAFEQRSRKTVTGYVQDGVEETFDTFTGAGGMEPTITEFGVGKQIVSPSMPCH